MSEGAGGRGGRALAGLVDVLAHPDEGGGFAGAREELAAAGVEEAFTATMSPAGLPPEDFDDAGPVRLRRGVGLLPAELDPPRLDQQLAAVERAVDERPVALLSEIGLDRRKGMPPDDAQEHAFRSLLALARRRSLPVLIHAVRAHGRLLAILDEVGELPAGAAVHGWTGAPEASGELVSRGLLVSFGARLLKDDARRAQASAQVVAEDYLLVETDRPSFPAASLPDVVRRLADLRGRSAEELAAATARNARRFLGS